MNKQTFVVSDETENSHGFIVKTEGINTENFIKNPIMLFMHERAKVIGRWENLKIEDGKMYADAVFDTDSELGSEVAQKVEKGFLKGASIGIQYNEEDLKENILEKCQLVEISIVDIGSNPNALKLYNNEQFTQLFFNSMQESHELADVLELKSPNHKQILKSIQHLKNEHIKLTAFKKETLQEREEEADEIINFAIQRKVLASHLKEVQKRLFKEDFNKEKAALRKLIANTYPVKTFSFAQMIKDVESEKNKKNKGELITLEDYRKYAPEKLQQDPDLYQRLLNETIFNK